MLTILQNIVTALNALLSAVQIYLTRTVIVKVTDFGADLTGVADSTTAIQNAINSLPPNGGRIIFPLNKNGPTVYNISLTINMGNGTASAGSSKVGIVLMGPEVPALSGIFSGFSVIPGVQIIWTGANNSTMFKINGPLQSWGLENLTIRANGKTGIVGLFVVSAQFGYCKNLFFDLCMNGILSRTVEPFGSFLDTDSLNNFYEHILVTVPDQANAVGIFLRGSGSGSPQSNTDYNEFSDISIDLAPTPANVIYGLGLEVCDSNYIEDLHVFGGGANGVAVGYNYSTSANFPSSNTINHVDPGGNSNTNWQNIGSPGASARPNYVYGLVETNGAKNPLLANVNPALPTVVAPGLDLTGQTTSLAGTNIFPYAPYVTGMYRFNVYLEVTTAGTGGTVFATVFWEDDSATVQSFSSTVINLNAKNFAQFSIVVREISGVTPTVSTTVAGALGGPVYAIHVRVEKLD